MMTKHYKIVYSKDGATFHGWETDKDRAFEKADKYREAGYDVAVWAQIIGSGKTQKERRR